MKEILATIAAVLCLVSVLAYSMHQQMLDGQKLAKPAIQKPVPAAPRFTSAVSVIECDTALAVAAAKSDGTMRIIHEPTDAQLKLLESVITDESQQFRVVIPCGHEGERL